MIPSDSKEFRDGVDEQLSIRVEQGRVFLVGRTGWWCFSSCRQKTCPPVQATSSANKS
jgi:hypothetical protein